MRDRVLGHGWPFKPEWSSNSRRRPVLFDWTDDPAKATLDTEVYLTVALAEGLKRPGRKIAWLLESPSIARWQRTQSFLEEHLEEVADAYEVILTSDRELASRHPKIRYHPAGSNLPWVPESRYGLYAKDRMCSMFASNKKMVDEHRYRARVAERLQGRVDVFGGAAGSPRIGGRLRHPDKSEGLLRYRFQVVMENSRTDLYYTEKITDCFATGTVPVYWGSDRIGELFDVGGILPFDDGFDPDTLSEDLYLSMLPSVRRNLELVRELESSDDLLYLRYLAPTRGVSVPATDGDGADGERGERSTTSRSGALARAWKTFGTPGGAGRGKVDDAALLARVAARGRRSVASVDEVPADRISFVPVVTRLEAPRGGASGDTWHRQIERVGLLRVPDAFIGDGVIFDDERFYSFRRWWWRSPPDAYCESERVEHVEAGLAVGAWGGEAFQHFVLDAIPKLGAALPLLDRREMAHVKIVSHLEGSPFARWFWQRLGLTERVVQKPRNVGARSVVHADLAISMVFEPNLDLLGVYPREILRPVQERLGLLEERERDLVVYLARHGPRRVGGDAEVTAALRRELAGSGLQLVVGRGRDWEEAEERFGRARVLIGPHGGAFANMIFCPPGTHVVEIVPRALQLLPGSGTNLAMYWGLAQAAGHHYWSIEPTSFDFEGTVEIDAETVAGTLRRILAAC